MGDEKEKISVVVGDFDVDRALVGPAKTNAILIIDRDCVLAGSVAGQAMQAVSRRHHEVRKVTCDVKSFELARCNAVQPCRTGLASRFGIDTVKDVGRAAIADPHAADYTEARYIESISLDRA
jgi:hypothetical protein